MLCPAAAGVPDILKGREENRSAQNKSQVSKNSGVTSEMNACATSVSLSVLSLTPDFIKVLTHDSFYIIDIY